MPIWLVARIPDAPLSGFCLFLNDNLISWPSRRQTTVSHSSAEAEYRVMAAVVAESCWVCRLLQELNLPISTATVVFCDNVSAVYLAHNLVQHRRTKHIELDIHFVREKVALGVVRVLHVPSLSQYADIFTKGLLVVLFNEFRSSLHLGPLPGSHSGGVLESPASCRSTVQLRIIRIRPCLDYQI